MATSLQPATQPFLSTHMSSTPRAIHLVILIHGLWGLPKHLKALKVAIIAAAKAKGLESDVDRPLINVLLPECNKQNATYDGIDYCGERLVNDIDVEVARQASTGCKVTQISFVGYSLGSLIARYACGLLEARQPSFFDTVEPMQFTAFASPWIGIPRYEGFLSNVIWHGGSTLLSRTGNQLYLVDKFHPYPVPSGQPAGPPQPLIALLAHPQTLFIRSLKRFRRCVIYANSVQDRTVPFVTGAVEHLDPFSDARTKACKAMRKASWPSSVAPDLSAGGVEVLLDPTYPPLISSWTYCQVRQPGKPPNSLTLSERLPVPRFLRPSFYPFKSPYNYVAAIFSPILFPLFCVCAIVSFVWHGRRSRTRIRKLTVAPLTEEGRWARVGLGMDVAAAVAIPTAAHEGLQGLAEGMGIAASADPLTLMTTLTTPQASTAPLPHCADETLSKALTKASGLSALQNELIDWINQLPNLRKHIAFFNHIHHSHGSIIYRAEGHSDPGGKQIIQHFVDTCLL